MSANSTDYDFILSGIAIILYYLNAIYFAVIILSELSIVFKSIVFIYAFNISIAL